MHFLFVLEHSASGLRYLGSACRDPTRYTPTIRNKKWRELVSGDARTELISCWAFRKVEAFRKRRREFMASERVRTSARWVNSDVYLDRPSPYVYLICHRETGLLYLGSKFARAANPSRLFKEYFTSSRRVKELGWQGFDVLEVRATPKARELEAKLLQSWYRHLGYDTFCATFLNRNTAPGIVADAETRRRQGRTMSEDMLSGRRDPPSFLGGEHSPEARLRISQAMRGRTLSQATRRKISEAARGRVFSEEHRAKLRAAKVGYVSHMLGKKHSEATKRKISLTKKANRLKETK